MVLLWEIERCRVYSVQDWRLKPLRVRVQVRMRFRSCVRLLLRAREITRETISCGPHARDCRNRKGVRPQNMSKPGPEYQCRSWRVLSAGERCVPFWHFANATFFYLPFFTRLPMCRFCHGIRKSSAWRDWSRSRSLPGWYVICLALAR